MKKKLLKEIIEKKQKKMEFSIITNLNNGESCIFEKNKPLNNKFKIYEKKINYHFEKKRNGIIEETNIFVDNYISPIKIIIVGAVHIAQYLVNFATNLNFEIYIIDPRGYFASENANRCKRLKESGFNDEQINKIFGPIGIKLGGKSAPEIALSIIAQLVSEVYKK